MTVVKIKHFVFYFDQFVKWLATVQRMIIPYVNVTHYEWINRNESNPNQTRRNYECKTQLERYGSL